MRSRCSILIKAAELLKGVRGGEPVDREALAALLVAVSRLVTDFPEIAEVDLNPVLARPDGAHGGRRADRPRLQPARRRVTGPRTRRCCAR